MFCSRCGRVMRDGERFCCACGQPTRHTAAPPPPPSPVPPVPPFGVTADHTVLQTLSQRLNTNGIIWIVIAALQILAGIAFDWFMVVIGVLNIISAIQDMQYSKEVLSNPVGIVARFEPIVWPIITLVYNLIIGGVIGVVGSIYYFVALRGFVMENRMRFAAFDMPPGASVPPWQTR